MDYEIDNLTIILLITFASLLIYLRFFSLSSPLVHPLLLGKQSEVSSVRRNGESGIYRSFATGQGSPVSVTYRMSTCMKSEKCQDEMTDMLVVYNQACKYVQDYQGCNSETHRIRDRCCSALYPRRIGEY